MVRTWTLAAAILCFAGTQAFAAPQPTPGIQASQVADATLAAKFDRIHASINVQKAESIQTLLMLEDYDTLIDPNRALDAYQALAQKTTNASLKRYASWKLNDMQTRLGHEYMPLEGEIDQFYVSFPFENASVWGFSQAFEPENGFDTSKGLKEARFNAPWQSYRATTHNGIVVPEDVVYVDDFGVIYLATRIKLDDAKKPVKARLELSTATPITAWINGTPVAHQTTNGAAYPPIFGKTWAATLKPGENLLVIKVAALDTNPALRVFLTDEKGQPLKFTVDLSQPIQSEPLAAPGETLKPVSDSLYETWTKDPKVPSAIRAALASRALDSKDADTIVRDLIMRDLKSLASRPVDEILLAVATVEDDWMKVEILREALKAAPNDKWLGYAWANASIHAASAQSSPIALVDVLPDLKPYLTQSFDPMLMALLNANVKKATLQRFMARAIMDNTTGDTNNSSWLSTYLTTFAPNERDQRLQTNEKLRAIERNSSIYLMNICKYRLEDARAAHDDATLAQALVLNKHDIDAFLARFPHDSVVWEYWLDLVDAYAIDVLAQKGYDITPFTQAGWQIGSDAVYAQWLDQCPNDPNRWQRYAAFATTMGDAENSATAYAMAASLKPQDETLQARSHFNKLGTINQEQYETPFIITDIPANNDESASSHVSLLDQRITRILPNGLTSTYNQLVFEIVDDAGIRALRAVPINYSPTDEKVEIISVTTTKKDGTVKRVFQKQEYNVADPSYRMYYDQRQIVISIPDLSVGDRVEFRFRRTQTHRESSSIPYFGDILQLQATFNKQWTRYIVIAPKEFPINFYRTTPDKSGFEAPIIQTDQGNETVSIFETKDTHRILMEKMTPGMTEIVPFLLVSSFSNWQQLADWIIELAKPQWTADDMIRNEVKRITQGVTDHREIINRIYNYVLRETRYVALEFGIHGFKPYPVPQILARKFGDCKDKASLMKVMLETAGIEAKFVLTRTRNNGDLDGKLPSPYLFDHAIVYVPEFDMYLDGTAEFNGTNELPALDQGAMTFIVNDDATYQLRYAPMSSAEDNAMTVYAEYDLSKDNTALFNERYIYTGSQAPYYRARYAKPNKNENTDIQLDRLQSDIASQIAGTKIISADFGDIDNLEVPVDFQFKATAPLSSFSNMTNLTPIIRNSILMQSFTSGADRQLPLLVPVPQTLARHLNIILPEGKHAELPPPTSFKNEFGDFTIEFTPTAQGYSVYTVTHVTKTRVEPSEYKAWQDFFQKIDQHLNTPIAIQ